MKKKEAKEEAYKAPCQECGGKCCKYIVIEIDTPRSKKDYHYIRWYLLHEKVNVFIDHNKKWHIEFKTPCVAQRDDHSCSIYKTRPLICRSHGIAEEECEFFSSPYAVYFSELKQYEKYLDNKGIDWKPKIKK